MGPDVSLAEERVQVERLLADPLFSQSRRYAAFLRFVTDRALRNVHESLTERSIGVEVFGRSPNYDTDADPIVRVTASEIRKRLAHYYENPAHAGEIRVLIHKGSYVAEFLPPGAQPVAGEVTVLERPMAALAPERTVRSRWRSAAGLLGICVVVAALIWLVFPRPTAFELFWKPVLSGSREILVSVPQISDHLHLEGGGDPLLSWSDSLTPTPDPMGLSWMQYSARLVHERDVSTACRLSEFLGSKGKRVLVRGERQISMRDLRETPAVILGGLNNQWTDRLLPQARFRFDGEGSIRYIQDAQNPAARKWSYDAKVPSGRRNKDLIIISRITDSMSGRVTVLAGGFSGWGTEAAVELLTDPDQMQTVLAQAPRRWDAKNVQIVLECAVVNVQSGIPRFLAAQYW